MAKSAVLGIDQLAENQANKHLVVNEMLSALESASNRKLTLVVDTGDRTLSETEFTRYFLFEVTSLNTERNVFVPATIAVSNPTRRFCAVRNNAAYDVTIKSSTTGGTEVVIGPGITTFLHIQDNNVTSIGSIGSGMPYMLCAYYPGLAPGSSVEVFRATFTESISFADNFNGSKGSAQVVATADTGFAVYRNTTLIGSVTFKTDDTVVFATIGSINEVFNSGDTLIVTAPATQDATLAGASITFKGVRV